MGCKVDRNRNGGEWTEAMYWSRVRSSLRNAFRYWKPAQEAKKRARVLNFGGGRTKYFYTCAKCGQIFKDKEVQIDHINPVGSLRSINDLASFLQRLTPESVDEFQILCKKCHLEKTKKESKR